MPLFNQSTPSTNSATLFTSTSTQTVAATVTETTIIGSGIGSLTLPANYLTVGKSVRLAIRGLYSTPTISAGKITVNIKLGSVLLATGSASSVVSTASNYGFDGECVFTCRTDGASGTVIIMGGVTYGVGVGLSPLAFALNNGTSTSTIDTTASQTLNATVTWSNNTAGNTVSSLNCLLEALN